MSQKSDEIISVAILIDGLKHDDVSERQKSMSQLEKIAKAIGPKRSKTELIPFLCECCDDDDEVLLILIQKLEQLPALMGEGSVQLIFEPLRLLAQSDSKVVRDAAVESLKQQAFTSPETQSAFCEITKQLLSSEFYNFKQSGVQLVSIMLKISQHKQEDRDQTLSLLTTAAKDALPMVRRQVAEALANVAAECSGKEIITVIKPLLQSLYDDTQDAVRAVSVRAVPSVLQRCQQLASSGDSVAQQLKDYGSEIYTYFLNKQCQEISWRTRYVCADLFSQVLEAACGFLKLSPLYTQPRETADSYEANESIDLYNATSAETSNNLAAQSTNNTDVYKDQPQTKPLSSYNEEEAGGAFGRLLSDSEAEVRCVACQRVVRVCNRLSLNVISTKILPLLLARAEEDDSQFVRLTLSRYVSYLAQLLPVEVIKQKLLDVVFKLLKDSDAEVRAVLLNNVQLIIQQVPIEAFDDRLVNAVLVLSDEQDWRIRKQTVCAISKLAPFMSSERFAEKLEELSFEYLDDSVNYVRRSAAANIARVASVYGVNFARDRVLPRLIDLAHRTSYLQRGNAVFMIQQLAEALPSSLQLFVGPLTELLNDPVPNVRFMAAEVTGGLLKHLNGGDRQVMEKRLRELLADADGDVRDFAADALKNA